MHEIATVRISVGDICMGPLNSDRPCVHRILVIFSHKIIGNDIRCRKDHENHVKHFGDHLTIQSCPLNRAFQRKRRSNALGQQTFRPRTVIAYQIVDQGTSWTQLHLLGQAACAAGVFDAAHAPPPQAVIIRVPFARITVAVGVQTDGDCGPPQAIPPLPGLHPAPPAIQMSSPPAVTQPADPPVERQVVPARFGAHVAATHPVQVAAPIAQVK